MNFLSHQQRQQQEDEDEDEDEDGDDDEEEMHWRNIEEVGEKVNRFAGKPCMKRLHRLLF